MPSGADLVGVAYDVTVEREDLRPAVRVAKLLLGDAGERVTSLHSVSLFVGHERTLARK